MQGRFRRVREGRESGLSLAEMMVTIFLLSIVLTIVTETIISASRTGVRTRLRENNTQQLRVGLDSTGKALRQAVGPDATTAAFLPGTTPKINGSTVVESGTECWFYTNLIADGATGTAAVPQLAHYYVNANNQLVEEFWRSTTTTTPYTYSGAPYRKRVLTSGLKVPTGTSTPIFTYYPSSTDPTTAVPLNGPDAATPAAKSVTYAVPSDQLLAISDVRITLTATAAGPYGSTTTMTNRVRMINADALKDPS